MAKSKIDQFKETNKKNNAEDKAFRFGGGENSVDMKLLSGFNMLNEDEDLRDSNSFKRGFRITKNLRSLGITGI
ncbi:hypothetical protein IPJ63_00405 [Candidatus Nomurabacteria bacterium]|nr:MAG: hypothetical protein IPJ63_00405 [Candidatus Nomurabacteria bacterium]